MYNLATNVAMHSCDAATFLQRKAYELNSDHHQLHQKAINIHEDRYRRQEEKDSTAQSVSLQSWTDCNFKDTWTDKCL